MNFTCEEVCTLSLAALNVTQNFVELVLVDLRPLLNTIPEWVTNHSPQCTSLRFLHKFIVDLLMDKSAGSRTAALALVEKESKVCELHCSVDICILANNHGGLPSQLQGHRFQVASRCCSHHQLTHLGRTWKLQFSVQSQLLRQLRLSISIED